MIRIVSFVLLLSLSAAAYADPAPFGLELGKTTVAEAKAKYRVTETGTNKYSNGPMFDVTTDQIEFDGLQGLTLIFDTKDTLVGVLATLPKSKFKPLHQTLSGKYRVVSQNIPFVGNSSAKYVDGSTEITLDAPHMSFEMSMNYIRKELSDAFAAQSAAEAQAKKRAEDSQL